MAHLSPAPRLRFSIQMKLYVRDLQGALPMGFTVVPEVSKEIGHCSRCVLCDITQGQQAYGSKLLFELAGKMRVHRKVPRIMWSGSKFVDEPFAIFPYEELHTEYAYDVQLLQHTSRDLSSLARH